MDLKEVYNQLSTSWANRHWEFRNTWCDDFLAILASRVGTDGKVLDVGCGSGEDCKFLADFGLKTTGIDFSEKFIKQAQKRFPKGKFLVMDILQLDFPEGSFDGAVAKHSLLHLKKKDLPTVLDRINKLLKKNGWFLLTLKEGTGEKVVGDVRFGIKINRFFSFYTNYEVKKVLKKAGFVVIEEGINKMNSDTYLKFLIQKV